MKHPGKSCRPLPARRQNGCSRSRPPRLCAPCWSRRWPTAQDASGLPGGAAGKTGTAQTGQFTAEGKERKNLWFAGFYPAEDPQYTIVVLQDGQTQAAVSSAAVFAQLCTALHWLG